MAGPQDDRIARTRTIAETELRYTLALAGRTPTPADLTAAADAAEGRDRRAAAAN